MRRLPPLGSIQAFVQVAKLGSVKAAADSLAVSPSALTRRIQLLEQFVSATLLDRRSNTIQLNSRGEQLLSEVEPHLNGLAEALHSASPQAPSSRLRVAVPSLFAAQRLMPALSDLLDRNPGLVIDMDTAPGRIARLEDGIDAAIAVAQAVDDKRYYVRPLERSRVIAVGAPKLATGDRAIREPADLARTTILLHRGLADAFDDWRVAVGLRDLVPAATSHFDSGQLILDAAAEGLGIAFMLESHLAYSDASRLTQFFGQSAETHYAYWFVCLPEALRRRPVRLFHDWLFERFTG